jgi:hypothetical protein
LSPIPLTRIIPNQINNPASLRDIESSTSPTHFSAQISSSEKQKLRSEKIHHSQFVSKKKVKTIPASTPRETFSDNDGIDAERNGGRNFLGKERGKNRGNFFRFLHSLPLEAVQEEKFLAASSELGAPNTWRGRQQGIVNVIYEWFFRLICFCARFRLAREH